MIFYVKIEEIVTHQKTHISYQWCRIVFTKFQATFLSKHTNVCFTSIWSMEFFQIARLPTPFMEFFQDIVETFDLVHGIFSQNSSSSETIHGIFSRYHWDFLEEFFGQFHTCKLYMKIWETARLRTPFMEFFQDIILALVCRIFSRYLWDFLFR